MSKNRTGTNHLTSYRFLLFTSQSQGDFMACWIFSDYLVPLASLWNAYKFLNLGVTATSWFLNPFHQLRDVCRLPPRPVELHERKSLCAATPVTNIYKISIHCGNVFNMYDSVSTNEILFLTWKPPRGQIISSPCLSGGRYGDWTTCCNKKEKWIKK